MVGYEASLILATFLIAYFVVRKDRGSFKSALVWVREQKGQPASVWLIGVIILAIMTSVTVMALQPARANAAIKACQANERTIESAIASYEAAVGPYPNISNVPVTVVQTSGGTTTAGTFSDPSNASTDYLGQLPIDPADPKGSYTLTVAGTVYSIVCPGGHPVSSLGNMTGGSTASKGQIVLQSQGGFSAQ